MTPLSLAFLPLTDAAPLIVAGARGFAAEAGIELDLVRTTSWATLRDRLVYGQVQGAHMLAPLAIAVTLGLSQAPAALSAPFRLNVNGNALAMAPDFAAALEPDPAQRVADPLAAAHADGYAEGLAAAAAAAHQGRLAPAGHLPLRGEAAARRPPPAAQR